MKKQPTLFKLIQPLLYMVARIKRRINNTKEKYSYSRKERKRLIREYNEGVKVKNKETDEMEKAMIKEMKSVATEFDFALIKAVKSKYRYFHHYTAGKVFKYKINDIPEMNGYNVVDLRKFRKRLSRKGIDWQTLKVYQIYERL